MISAERASGSYLELGQSVREEQELRQSQLRGIFTTATDLLKSEKGNRGRFLVFRVNILRTTFETERGAVGVEILANGELDKTNRLRIHIDGLYPITVTRKKTRGKVVFSAKKNLSADEYLAWQHHRERLTPQDYEGFAKAMQQLSEAA